MSLPEPMHLTGPNTRARPFWARVAVGDADECWPWLAALNHGYGRPMYGGQAVYAHRLAYELLVGPVPDGLEIDHLCRNRACCNPRHLEPVTHRENGLRGESIVAQQARRTRCPRGHEYTVVVEGGRTRRRCMVCASAAWARSYERKKASKEAAA